MQVASYAPAEDNFGSIDHVGRGSVPSFSSYEIIGDRAAFRRLVTFLNAGLALERISGELAKDYHGYRQSRVVARVVDEHDPKHSMIHVSVLTDIEPELAVERLLKFFEGQLWAQATTVTNDRLVVDFEYPASK